MPNMTLSFSGETIQVCGNCLANNDAVHMLIRHAQNMSLESGKRSGSCEFCCTPSKTVYDRFMVRANKDTLPPRTERT